ncbi:glycoside hydrolase family 9 protein [Alkalihalobacillus trypoxylicola]|uniref:Endoglucanase n=1 Tax=Alkalihalobacillus trypoxylicola TaxID=519424 RepID=A0A162F2J8_9BACI|nr:glycoside hydrolase family 9 protein [Alkalihalobacillus trypoxylicola]KYG34348.1 glycoside hydrolase [Alkalihalobacillus trypoxylicola]
MKIEKRKIVLNQLGYLLDKEKRAISTEASPFSVVDKNTNSIVFSGEAFGPIFDQASSEQVYVLDFSDIQEEGDYYIKQSESKSLSFPISEKPYESLQNGVLKAFYFLRCGMELKEEYAGVWKHKACHTSKGKVLNEPHLELDCSGGWHDAGDYGKYTVAAAKALADLLLAYQTYPQSFLSTISIPESDGIIPDILHEARYELEWLLKMQNLRDGGVFHKVTTLAFPGLDVMPEEDEHDLYLCPVSSTATASFVAVLALASTVYRAIDEAFSIRCLEAARKSWSWLESNPEMVLFKNPEEVSTGEYGDSSDLDERYWAAAQMYHATKEEVYHHAFKELFLKDFKKCELGWTNVSGYGTLSYLSLNIAEADDSIQNELKREWVGLANALLQQKKTNGYPTSLRENDFIWGSNMVLLNHAMTLLYAFHFSGKESFEQGALAQLDYLLGCNPLGYSYVTGFGANSIQNPHYRPAVGDGIEAPIPGMIAGGPNKGLQDEYAKQVLDGYPPSKCFVDHQDSYSTNEITIYWNSPAIFVLAHFNDLDINKNDI